MIIPWEVRETLYSMLLSQRQTDILIGTILGDGHLEKNGHGVRLKVGHGKKQTEYTYWKYFEMKNLTPSPPRSVKEFHKSRKMFDESVHFATFSDLELVKWRDLFYESGVKAIPKNISDILRSPLSLAVWYMDDGYKRNDCNALRISTDSFSLNDHHLLVNCLEKNFEINAQIHKKDKTNNIYIPNKFTKKFCDIVRPYIVDSLLYKVSLAP
ncbi:MAG: hypothetical protein HYX22_02045 [Candidatus Yanofskybacteria bacterium]|nr:hypothetical protein [Candidatus Yanofskybacteria bacterium]